MAKFINTVTLVGNDDCESQLEFDTKALSAAIVYMAEYYEKVFSGLDSLTKAINDIENKETVNPYE